MIGIAFAGCLLLLIAGMRASAAQDELVSAKRQNEAQAAVLEQQQVTTAEAIDALAQGLEVAIFVCDLKGTIIYANPRSFEFFGLSKPFEQPILNATLSYELSRLVQQTAAGRKPQRTELTFTYPSQRTGIVTCWTESFNPKHVYVSVIDVTDLRRLERVRQDFVANVSHELRTPMTILRSMAETLLDNPDDKAQRNKFLATIVAEIDRLSAISEDLLTLSAAEEPVKDLEIVDLAQLVKGSLNSQEEAANRRGLGFELEAKGPCPVLARPTDLSQIARNLVDNAIKYTQQGRVRVQVGCEGSEAVLRVSDTGLGIAAEHQERVFERFYRVDKGRSRESGGTGLGLSIVRHLVENFAGAVELESSLNRGSTFTVRIPLAAGDGKP